MALPVKADADRIVHSRRSVEIAQGRLRVWDWETSAEDVVKFFEERAQGGHNLQALLEQVVRTGVIALRAAGTLVNIDHVEREFQRLATEVLGKFEMQANTVVGALVKAFAQDGDLVNALDRYLGTGGRLSDLFDPQRRDSALGRIQEILDQHFKGKGSVLHQLLNPTDPQSPLHQLQSELKKDIEKLRRVVEEYRKDVTAKLAAEQAAAEAFEKTPAKGIAYQELVFQALSQIAKAFGDTAEFTGETSGIGGSKVGDMVVTINPRDAGGVTLRMAFEAKDKTVGLKPIERELDEARQNRNAGAAVAVYSRAEHMPAGTAPFHECHENLYLCLLDKDAAEDTGPLQLAYRVSRYWLLKQLTQTSVRAIDPAAVGQRIAEARKLLANFANLKRRVTQLKNATTEGTDALEQELGKLRDTLQEAFDEIDVCLNLGATAKKSRSRVIAT